MSQLIACPRCGHRNIVVAKYCANCGVKLAAAGAVETPSVSKPPAFGSQRSRRRRTALYVVLGAILIYLAYRALWIPKPGATTESVVIQERTIIDDTPHDDRR